MTNCDLHHLLNTLEACEAEFEQLMIDNEWFVTSVVDQIQSAKELVTSQLKESKKYDSTIKSIHT